MTTDRPYRRARPIWRALDALDTDVVNGRRDRALIDEFSAMINDSDPLLPFTSGADSSVSAGNGRQLSQHG